MPADHLTTFVVAVFAAVYLGMALGRWPGLRIDRTGIALLGAILLYLAGAVTGEQAREAIDAPTLIILFGLMVLSAPIQALAALAIRLESHGHPIYTQGRVGRHGHAFEVYKLRTMVSGAEHMGSGMAVDEGDTRITRVGAILRRTSIDELPNLVNVIRGEMSLVGPRPTIQVQVDQYTDRQRRRLDVRPGLTGWAQVNGNTLLSSHEKLALDLWYVDHCSLWLDLKILFKTADVVIRGEPRDQAGPLQDPR